MRRPAVEEEKCLACLLGGALGDAFGYAIEFAPISAIRARFGKQGMAEPVFRDGKLLVSDDTQMTLFTLEGMLNAVKDGGVSLEAVLPAIRTAYLDWLATQDYPRNPNRAAGWLGRQPEMHALRAPGNTCLSALEAGGKGNIASPVNDSKGCGGVMRVAPVGLFFRQFGTAETFRLGAEAAALTHGHPSGYLSAGVMASLIRLLVAGADVNSALRQSRELLQQYAGHEETLREMSRAVSLAGPKPDHVAAIAELGGGWVGEEALAIGVYAVLSAHSFVESVRIAANHSGDSDSTASIAGQLWGAMHGIEGMPHAWILALDVLTPLLRLVRESGTLMRKRTRHA